MNLAVGVDLLIRDGALTILGPEDLAEVLGLLEPLHATRDVTSSP